MQTVGSERKAAARKAKRKGIRPRASHMRSRAVITATKETVVEEPEDCQREGCGAYPIEMEVAI